MSISTTAQQAITITYSQIDTQPNATVRDLAQSGHTINLGSNATGTGNPMNTGVASLVWNASLSLNSGATHQIDLMNLTRSMLNGNITLSLGSGYLSSLFINNLSNNTGVSGVRKFSDVILRATGSNPLNSPWGGGSGGNVIKAGNPFLLSSVLSGFPVTTTQRYLYLIDGGGSTNVDLMLLGVARTGS
jgi:hypothetical protein